MNNPLPSLMTVKQVAICLQVSERTVRRYLADGDLVHKKIGKLVRVERDALLSFIEGNSIQQRQ